VTKEEDIARDIITLRQVVVFLVQCGSSIVDNDRVM